MLNLHFAQLVQLFLCQFVQNSFTQFDLLNMVEDFSILARRPLLTFRVFIDWNATLADLLELQLPCLWQYFVWVVEDYDWLQGVLAILHAFLHFMDVFFCDPFDRLSTFFIGSLVF